MLFRAILMLCALATLGGCAFGQKVDYRQSTTFTAAQSDTPVVVNIIDERPYVLSGNKSPTFVGVLRALYYNPFNVNTLTGLPLSSDIGEAVRVSLERASIQASVVSSTNSAAPGQKLLLLLIREWKTDTYMRARFDYDMTATVYDGAGKVLATKSVKNSGATKNFIMAGSGALNSVLNDNEIVAALSAKSAPVQALPVSSTPLAKPSYDECMRRIAKISDPSLRASSMSMCDGVK